MNILANSVCRWHIYFLAFLSDRCYVIWMRACFCFAPLLRIDDVMATRHWCVVQRRAPHAASRSLTNRFLDTAKRVSGKHVYNALNPFLRIYSFITSFTQAFIQVYRLDSLDFFSFQWPIFKDLTNILNINSTGMQFVFILYWESDPYISQNFVVVVFLHESVSETPAHTI